MSKAHRCDWYERMLTNAHAATVDRQVFFILGCQKSGTTWLQALLHAHPEVACRGEAHLTDSLFLLLKRAIDEYCASQISKGRVEGNHLLPGVDDLLAATKLLSDQTLARYLACEPDAGAILAIGDKTPEYACAMPILARLYPSAKFIHIIRDGRDAAVSGWAHLERKGQQHSFESFADYAAYFAERHWVQYITQARHLGAQLGSDRFLEIRYEAMRESPESHARQIFAFIGVDHDDATTDACVRETSFRRLSGGRAAGEEDRGSHFRKGIAGDWVNHFDAEATRRFETIAGDLLEGLGYQPALTANT